MTSLIRRLSESAHTFLTVATSKGYISSPGDLAGGIEAGDLEELELGNDERVGVKVLAVDTISVPHRARVERVDTGEVLVVPILDRELERQQSEAVVLDTANTTVYQDYEDAFTRCITGSLPATHDENFSKEPNVQISDGLVPKLVGAIQSELQATVEDFQEKGAILAFRDAAEDACNMIVDAAHGAKSLIIEDSACVVACDPSVGK